MEESFFSISRVFYIYGVLDGQGLLKDVDSLDDIEKICKKIINDWENEVDIRDEEERGYPTAYTQRVLLEKCRKGDY